VGKKPNDVLFLKSGGSTHRSPSFVDIKLLIYFYGTLTPQDAARTKHMRMSTSLFTPFLVK